MRSQHFVSAVALAATLCVSGCGETTPTPNRQDLPADEQRALDAAVHAYENKNIGLGSGSREEAATDACTVAAGLTNVDDPGLFAVAFEDAALEVNERHGLPPEVGLYAACLIGLGRKG